MNLENLAQNWNFDQIFDALDKTGFALLDTAYPAEFLNKVREECLGNLQQFREAAIQNGVVSKIRSDHILWIEENFEQATNHTKALEYLGQQFNQYFFSNIREIEAHFACYDAGEYYALHRDNPQQKNNRILSCVFYLHESWQADWGGQLRLQDKNDEWHIIEPLPNRIAIFQSDLLHEVLPAQRQRLSITAWLRSQTDLW